MGAWDVESGALNEPVVESGVLNEPGKELGTEGAAVGA